jgi:hypothetical protein
VSTSLAITKNNNLCTDNDNLRTEIQNAEGTNYQTLPNCTTTPIACETTYHQTSYNGVCVPAISGKPVKYNENNSTENKNAADLWCRYSEGTGYVSDDNPITHQDGPRTEMVFITDGSNGPTWGYHNWAPGTNPKAIKSITCKQES